MSGFLFVLAIIVAGFLALTRFCRSQGLFSPGAMGMGFLMAFGLYAIWIIASVILLAAYIGAIA